MVVHQGDMHKAAQNAVNLYLHMMSKPLFICRVTECDLHPKLHLVDLVIQFVNHLRLEQFSLLLLNIFPSLLLAEISHSTRPAIDADTTSFIRIITKLRHLRRSRVGWGRWKPSPFLRCSMSPAPSIIRR